MDKLINEWHQGTSIYRNDENFFLQICFKVMFNKVLFDLSGTRKCFHSGIIFNFLCLGDKVYIQYTKLFLKKIKGYKFTWLDLADNY